VKRLQTFYVFPNNSHKCHSNPLLFPHPICKGLRQSFKVSYVFGVLVFKLEDENLFVFLLARLVLSFHLRTPHMAQNLTLNRQMKLFHSLAFFGKCFSFISFFLSVCGKSYLLFFHPTTAIENAVKGDSI
jgi:hypothetical protein